MKWFFIPTTLGALRHFDPNDLHFLEREVFGKLRLRTGSSHVSDLWASKSGGLALQEVAASINPPSHFGADLLALKFLDGRDRSETSAARRRSTVASNWLSGECRRGYPTFYDVTHGEA